MRAFDPRVALLLLALAAGCGDVGAASAPVVYGADDRVEVYEQPAGVHRSIAESAIAMQIDVDDLDLSDPTDVRITYPGTLGETHTLCADVRYQDQIDPGWCSGTLIDERHILTAGHCVSATDDCDGASWPWVFGFHYEGPGELRRLSADDVYHCVATVVLQDDAAGDYAVVELDRPVVGHTPARVRLGPSDAPLGTPVTLIGHPNGIAMKIAGGATVRGASGVELYADVDAFFGNSGSGVFDDAGEAVGILVAGAPRDFARRPGGGGCREIVVIDPVPDGDGEVLTAVSAPMNAFCALPGERSSACGPASADAGAPELDAGAPGLDAGMPAVDGGASDSGVATDSGVDPALDAAVPGNDAGEPDGGDGGCGCRAGSARGKPQHVLLLIGLAWLVRRRRARRI